MPKNMPICLALFGATEDDGSNRRNIERSQMIHVFTFVKGDETLSMAYTSEGVMTMDTMAPIEDGWDYDSITDIPMLDESYDSIKTLWEVK